MPKTFPIRLEVEEIALGAVLRKLNEMPGIAKLDLDLGHGGQGAGRKELEDAASQRGVTYQDRIVMFLQDGPKHVREIRAHVGGEGHRAYGTLHTLRKLGLVKTLGKGMHALTARAAQAPKALPAPKITHGPGGRATPGAGPVALRQALANGPMRPTDIYNKMGELGLSRKSTSGILMRAKRDKIITKNGEGYALTAKGEKIEVAHG